MKQLHIELQEDSPAMKWADAQADKIGARGHTGTHLDCYTSCPEKDEYNIIGVVLDCRQSMPQSKDIANIENMDGMALILHTGNMEKHKYGTEEYFSTDTFLTEECLETILDRHPMFIITDSHGIAEKGMRHISFDKRCEEKGCHVIENADLSELTTEKHINLKILVDIDHPSTGKPCKLYYIQE